MATVQSYTRSSNNGENYRPSGEPHSTDVRVNFSNEYKAEEEERRKYLTAKYGAHQMRLIRKRLAVEDWLDKELRKLYDTTDDSDTYDCEIDMDELLDVEAESERRKFILSKLANCRKSQDVLNKFVMDILEKANTL